MGFFYCHPEQAKVSFLKNTKGCFASSSMTHPLTADFLVSLFPLFYFFQLLAGMVLIFAPAFREKCVRLPQNFPRIFIFFSDDVRRVARKEPSVAAMLARLDPDLRLMVSARNRITVSKIRSLPTWK